MDTDNDLEEIDPLKITHGMLVRAVDESDVKVEGHVFSASTTHIRFGSVIGIAIPVFEWKFFRVYDGDEVNRG